MNYEKELDRRFEKAMKDLMEAGVLKWVEENVSFKMSEKFAQKLVEEYQKVRNLTDATIITLVWSFGKAVDADLCDYMRILDYANRQLYHVLGELPISERVKA